jgi:hypothetical protein
MSRTPNISFFYRSHYLQIKVKLIRVVNSYIYMSNLDNLDYFKPCIYHF